MAKIFVHAKINFNCQLFNQLNFIACYKEPVRKGEKGIDNVRVSLNKIHVDSCFLRLFPSF